MPDELPDEQCERLLRRVVSGQDGARAAYALAHEIVVYLDGYRSLRQRLYVSPNSTRKIEGTLEKLAAGEPVHEASHAQPGNRPEFALSRATNVH